MLDNSVTKLMNEEDVYQIVKKVQYKMNISIVSFLFICFCICLTISAKTDRLSRRYGDSIQSSMPTYPLSYSVIQGVFDKDANERKIERTSKSYLLSDSSSKQIYNAPEFQNEQSYRLNDLLRLGDVKYNDGQNEKYFQSKKIKEKDKRYKTNMSNKPKFKASKVRLLRPSSNQKDLATNLIDLAIMPQKQRSIPKSKKTKEKLVPRLRTIPYNPQPPMQYERRQLNVKEVDKSKIIRNKTSKSSNNLSSLILWIRRIFDFGSSSKSGKSITERQGVERQGALAAPFALNTIGAGLAVVASLVGVAAVAGNPFARASGDASPVEETVNEPPSTTPVDCEYQDWTAWTSCSVSCGGGSKSRRKLIKTPALNGGRQCDQRLESNFDKVQCNTQICPAVDCQWAGWGNWAACSQTCGGGSQQRKRKHSVDAINGGAECIGSSLENQSCKEEECPPVNCVWSSWHSWTTCSYSCGGGVQLRSRKIDVHEESGGRRCIGPSIEQQICNLDKCPPVDCTWEQWTSWSSCSSSCGQGRRNRYRRIQSHEENGGSCDGASVETSQTSCGTCPDENCDWSSWSSWSDCSVTCGGSVQLRTRVITKTTKNDGKCSGSPVEIQHCGTTLCPGGVMSWTQTLPSGAVSNNSSYCSTMETFQESLAGIEATSIVLGAGSRFYSCTDRAIAQQITNALSNCKSDCSSQSFVCKGKVWNVGKCKSGAEISVGSNLCTCSGSLAIRPCVNDENWGGAGPSTCAQDKQTLSITINYKE